MSIDIGIGDGKSIWPLENEPSLTIDDTEYFWALHPFFLTLFEQTGKYIDLYGEATLQGEHLTALEQTLSAAEAFTHAQPTAWQVAVSAQVSSASKVLFKSVDRDRLLTLLNQMRKIVSRAREIDRPVVCFGD